MTHGPFPLVNERVLSIGIDPRDLDPSTLRPGVTVESLVARAAAGEAAIVAAGFDVTTCLVGTDPDAAEVTVRARLAEGVFGLAMVGGGIRALPENTLLFERLVNVLADHAPRMRFCFNTGPDSTAEALGRWIRP